MTGAGGYLGHEFVKTCAREGVSSRLLGRDQGIDLSRPFDLDERFEGLFSSPAEDRIVFHLAAMSRWEDCEREPDTAARVNAEATGALAAAIRRFGGRLVYVSTDLVFDGEHAPYDEESDPRPASIYGRTKRLGEVSVLAEPRNLVIRLPLLFGPSFDGKRGAGDSILARIRNGEPVVLFRDEWRTPLHVARAAEMVLAEGLDPGTKGIRHLPGPERLSRLELGLRLIREAGLDDSLVEEGSRLDMPGVPRPRDCSLSTLYPPPGS